MSDPRILVLRGGAIGDFVVTLPALQAMRNRWPRAFIELVGYPHVVELARAAGIVDSIRSLDGAGIARFFAFKPSFSDEQKQWISSFDLVICYLHDPEGTVQENLRLAGASQILYASPRDMRSHAVDHFLKPLETLAIYEAGALPALHLFPGANEYAGRIAIHPGSGSPKKNWPVERYIETARRLDQRAVFVAGEADVDLVPLITTALPDAPWILGQTLLEVARALGTFSSYIGNDSGITHLAAALGIPTLAIFGPTSALQWGPRGPRVKIVTAPRGDLTQIPVTQILSAFQSLQT